MIRVTAFALVLALGAGPALAYPNCTMTGGPGLRVEIGIGFGKFTEAEQNEFYLMQARRHGIDADTAEKTWLDCVKITRFEGGRWVTEYYDPKSWDLVPIN